MAYKHFPRQRLQVWPLAQRRSKHRLDQILLDPASIPPAAGPLGDTLDEIVAQIRRARQAGAAVILAYGAHLVKNGLGPLVGQLASAGWITHLATNGAGTIHDWEYAFLGRSEEDVRTHVAAGRFGSWDETSRYIHLAVLCGALEAMGYGEALGRFIVDQGCQLPDPAALAAQLRAWTQHPGEDALMPARAELLQFMRRFGLSAGTVSVPHPHNSASLTAAAYRSRVPLTVHPGIGYDIIYNHPMANGAALGRGADIDFSVFCAGVAQLDNGVFLSVGSAVMAPQIFEKALSAANNLRRQEGQNPIQPFIVVNDLAPINWDWSQGEPPPSNPAYYLRFCKSFSRMGGQMRYVCADNRLLVHHLHRHLLGAGSHSA